MELAVAINRAVTDETDEPASGDVPGVQLTGGSVRSQPELGARLRSALAEAPRLTAPLAHLRSGGGETDGSFCRPAGHLPRPK